MLVETFDVLSDHHLANAQLLARTINEVLLADTVSAMSAVADKAQISDQIRVALVGSQYSDDATRELNDMMLTYTRPLGPCHDTLPPGVELCSAWVSRKIQDKDGNTVLIPRKPGRFVTDDPETAAIYRLSPQIERVTNAMFRAGGIFRDSVERMPALAAYTQHYIARVHKVADAQLPMGSGNGNGGTPSGQ